MLLSTLSIYRKVSEQQSFFPNADDNQDYEVDRLYNSSPIILDCSDTYIVDEGLMAGAESPASKESTPSNSGPKSDISGDKFKLGSMKEEDPAELFRAVDVPSIKGRRVHITAENKDESPAKLHQRLSLRRQEEGPDSDEDSDANSKTRRCGDIGSEGSEDDDDDNDSGASSSHGPVSLLTKLIAQKKAEADDVGGDFNGEGGIKLTLFLPDFTPMNLRTNPRSNFSEIILQVLQIHKKRGMKPLLNYSNPSMYELRLHEGDGEPDRDFPALDPEKKLLDFNFDEYCLCEVGGSSWSGGGGAVGSASTASLFNGLTGGSEVASNSSGGGSPARVKGGERERARRDVAAAARFDSVFQPAGVTTTAHDDGLMRDVRDAQRMRLSKAELPAPSLIGAQRGGAAPSPKFAGSSDHRSDYSDSIDQSLEALMGNAVSIIFPSGERLDVFYDSKMKMIELLPIINRTQRLRLYTNEYVFQVSTEDQKRLKLMTPLIDMGMLVADVGVTTFEIHKKVYADGVKVKRGGGARKLAAQQEGGADRIHFNDATAFAYQEWNVIKKNKFGRKQERTFGVDGKKVYNAKRGQLKGGNQTGVQRAERNISTIVSIEVLASDPKTFRITWMDDRDLYNIEYTCDTTRECAEIVAKVKYTLNRNMQR